jgi:predicted Zn-dependent protease
VMFHEFGHLVGLAHVDDKRQLMYPHTGRPDFEDGDRAGLIALSQLPCG